MTESNGGSVPMAVEPCAACKKRQEKEPQGYVAWMEWAEKKSRRYRQTQCPTCGRFSIWKRP